MRFHTLRDFKQVGEKKKKKHKTPFFPKDFLVKIFNIKYIFRKISFVWQFEPDLKFRMSP